MREEYIYAIGPTHLLGTATKVAPANDVVAPAVPVAIVIAWPPFEDTSTTGVAFISVRRRWLSMIHV